MRREKDRKKQRLEEAKKPGDLVYTTSTGWLGNSAESMGKLVEDAVAPRFIQLRLNIVGSRETHKRRQGFARRTAEYDKGNVLIHGNQVRLVDVHTIYQENGRSVLDDQVKLPRSELEVSSIDTSGR